MHARAPQHFARARLVLEHVGVLGRRDRFVLGARMSLVLHAGFGERGIVS